MVAGVDHQPFPRRPVPARLRHRRDRGAHRRAGPRGRPLARPAPAGRGFGRPGPQGAGNGEGGLRIGVVRLPRLSNYTDFDPLEHEPGVEPGLSRPSRERSPASTCSSSPAAKAPSPICSWLRAQRPGPGDPRLPRRRRRIAGICGGYQMLGRRLRDPQRRRIAARRGGRARSPRCRDGPFAGEADASGRRQDLAGGGGASAWCRRQRGHRLRDPHGRDDPWRDWPASAAPDPACRLHRTPGDGAISADGRVWGTYLHGLFDSADRCASCWRRLRPGAAMAPRRPQRCRSGSELDRLADHLAAHLDLETLFRHLPPPGNEAP